MDAYAQHFGASGIPHAYLVDCMGVVRWHGHPADPSMANKIDVLANERAAKAAEDVTTVPPSELTAAILSSLNMADVKWAITHNHLNPADYLEKGEMLDALIQANKMQATKLRGKIALPKAAAQAAKTEEKAASTQPSTPLADLTSETVAAMSVSQLKRVIQEHNITIPVGDVEKSDLVKAIVAVLK